MRRSILFVLALGLVAWLLYPKPKAPWKPEAPKQPTFEPAVDYDWK